MADYGNGWTSSKGTLKYNGARWDSLSNSQAAAGYEYLSKQRALGNFGGSSASNLDLEIRKLRAGADAYAAERAQAEYSAMMAASMKAQNEAMEKQLELSAQAADLEMVEPLKSAGEKYTAAAADVARRQQLRGGLLSLYSRYGAAGSTRSASLEGKGTILSGREA